jgi:tRNA threonylcarbamoyladenosine biosynthesis protein TsaE
MKAYLVENLDELDDLAFLLKDEIIRYKNILIYGEMGAGKTTFIKALGKVLSCKDNISSPTYAIVNEYDMPPSKIFHFDLFRLNSKEEVLDIGFEDYLDQNALCIIEWPQLAEGFIETGLKIEIEKIDLNRRKFSIFSF